MPKKKFHSLHDTLHVNLFAPSEMYHNKKRRRSRLSQDFVHKSDIRRGNHEEDEEDLVVEAKENYEEDLVRQAVGNNQENLVREDVGNDQEDLVPEAEIEPYCEKNNDEDEDGSTSSNHSGNGSESSDDDVPQSSSLGYTSRVDESIDLFRMSRKLWKANKERKILKHELQSKYISLSNPKTVYEISKRLFDWKGSNKVSDEGLKELVEMLKWAGVGGLPSPNDLLRQGIGCIPEIRGLANIDSFLCFQQCPKSCMVYHGDHSRDLHCNICESPRFDACSKCSPLECCCLMNSRTPMKTFYYSSLIFYLRDKLSQPTAANFVMALKTEVVKVKDTHINDISDGTRVKKALKDMVATFEAYSNKSTPQNLIMVNLVLGGYYDGAQLYKNQVASFWPAGISILNLPPSYRFKEGIGFHLWAIFMGQTPSNAEDYLFRSCLGEELKVLKHGIVIADKYFVQARFVISVMDTKGQQHFTKFQSQASCSPCPCCDFRGTHVGKVVYTDHRKYLGWTHAYRAIGQSRKCCPEHQYSTERLNSRNKEERGRFWRHIETLHPEGSAEAHLRYVSKLISTRNDRKGTNERETLAESVCNDEQGSDTIYSEIMKDGCNFIFYHDHKYFESDKPTFCYTDFMQHMYFVSCYYKDYKCDERTSEKELRTRMREADNEILQKNRERSRNGLMPFNELKDPENGCHGSFPLVDAPVSIQSFMIWDPFHVLPNVFNRLLALLSGKTKFSVATRDICNRVGMHKTVAQGNQENGERNQSKNKVYHPWQINQDDMNLLDGVINCCMIATGFGSEFQLRYLFKQGGMLNSASKIQLLRIIAPVLAAFSGLPEAYQQFIRMLHHDIVYLFRPFFEGPGEIDKLFLLVVETVVTYEGLFPISEHIHGFHQLLCLVKQIKEFGPIRNLMGAVMERSLKSIKDVNPNGGGDPFRTQIRRYMSLMKQRHGQAFRFKIRRMKIHSSSHMRRVRKLQKEINDPGVVSVISDDDCHRFQYNDAKVCLWNEATKRSEAVKMDHDNIETFFEQSLLIEALLHEIKRQGEEQNSLLFKASVFFRVILSNSTHDIWKTIAIDHEGINKTKFIKAFVCWIYFVATGCMHTEDKHVIPDPPTLAQIFKKINVNDTVAEYKSTFISIHRLFTEKVKYYRKANAYGIRINSQLSSMDATFADDSKESGQRIFDESYIASSFCKYHDLKDKPRYALCQYFFRVVCPSDQIIHGMPLARVLQINTFTNNIIGENLKLGHKQKKCVDYIKFGLTGILVENETKHRGLALFPHNCCQFIPLTRFFSTSVILIPLDTDYKPMLHKIKRRSYAKKEQLKNKKVISKTNEIGMFYVIDFHPERSVYLYHKKNNGEYNKIQNDY